MKARLESMLHVIGRLTPDSLASIGLTAGVIPSQQMLSQIGGRPSIEEQSTGQQMPAEGLQQSPCLGLQRSHRAEHMGNLEPGIAIELGLSPVASPHTGQAARNKIQAELQQPDLWAEQQTRPASQRMIESKERAAERACGPREQQHDALMTGGTPEPTAQHKPQGPASLSGTI